MRGTRSIFGGIAVLATAGSVVVAPFGVLPIALAATATWDTAGPSASWATAANWGGVGPLPGDDLVFAGTGETTVNNIAAGTAYNSITVDGGYALNGNSVELDSTLTLNAGSASIGFDIDLTGSTLAVGVASGGLLVHTGNLVGTGGGFTKSGSGTLAVNGISTYDGPTVANSGTLTVAGSIASSSSLQVNNATVNGSGALPATTVTSGGTLAAGGGSAGIISTGTLSLASGATLDVDLGGTTVGTQYDQVDVTGTVSLGGSTLAISQGFAPVTGDAFTIIDNDGSDAITGTFLGLAEGATVVIGAHTYAITYVGGTGNDVVLDVSHPTTTTLTSSDLTTSVGESVTFTATISPTAGSSGATVEFREGAAVLGTGVVNGSGQATFTTSALALGSHTIRAFHLGQPTSDASASNTITQVVGQAATSTTLAASPNPSTFGDAVTLTATVSSAFGTPTGTVDFFDGATPLGSGTLTAGDATLTTSSLSVGTHSITAVYAGTTNFATSSTSGPISVVVDPPATTTTIAATTTTVAATTTTVVDTTTTVVDTTTTTTTVAGATTTTVAGAGSGAGLPTTGSNALRGLLVALVAAVGGLGAVLTARRRTRA